MQKPDPKDSDLQSQYSTCFSRLGSLILLFNNLKRKILGTGYISTHRLTTIASNIFVPCWGLGETRIPSKLADHEADHRDLKLHIARLRAFVVNLVVKLSRVATPK